MKPTNIRTIPHAEDQPCPLHALYHYVYKQTGRTISTFFVQEKFNGVGFRARLVNGEPELWTTRNKVWPAGFFPPLIYNGLAQILIAQPPDTVLLGELTDDTTKLATLAGQVSVNSEKFTGNPATLCAHVYDLCLPAPVLFQYRIENLKPFVNWQHANVRAVPTFWCETMSSIAQLYNDVIADGGEGVIIRFDPCIVTPEDTGQHPMILKWKKLFEAEGICLSVYEGQGKRTGMLGGFVLEAVIGGIEITFNLGGGAGLNDAMLKHYWENPPIGQPITFTYEELSINNVPLRPQFVAVRNYEA